MPQFLYAIHYFIFSYQTIKFPLRSSLFFLLSLQYRCRETARPQICIRCVPQMDGKLSIRKWEWCIPEQIITNMAYVMWTSYEEKEKKSKNLETITNRANPQKRTNWILVWHVMWRCDAHRLSFWAILWKTCTRITYADQERCLSEWHYIKTAGPLTSKMEKMAAALPRNNNSHIYNIKKNSPRPKHHFIHSQDDMVEIFFGFAVMSLLVWWHDGMMVWWCCIWRCSAGICNLSKFFLVLGYSGWAQVKTYLSIYMGCVFLKEGRKKCIIYGWFFIILVDKSKIKSVGEWIKQKKKECRRFSQGDIKKKESKGPRIWCNLSS